MKGRVLLTGLFLGIAVCGAIKLLSSKSNRSAKKSNTQVEPCECDSFAAHDITVVGSQFTGKKIDTLQDISDRHRAAADMMSKALIQKGEDTPQSEDIQTSHDGDFEQIDEELNNLLK